jgi:hypothetical protein
MRIKNICIGYIFYKIINSSNDYRIKREKKKPFILKLK